METRDLYGDVWISMICMELYGWLWVCMDISWFHFLGFSYEFILTLDLLKVGLVKP